MCEASVVLTGLTLGYEGAPAIQNVTGTIRKGSLTALIGPNGSGKTTLLKGLAGILEPLSGSCSVDPDERIAYLPQLSELDRSFPASVKDLVSLGLWPERGLLRRHRAEDRQRLTSALNAVSLTGFENRSLNTLSGGQLQRALFARIILQDAKLILLDEPFNAIDGTTIRDLLSLIQRWHAQKRTILVAIHDITLVYEHFPDTLFVNGEIIAWGETETVLRHEPSHRLFAMNKANPFPVQSGTEQ